MGEVYHARDQQPRAPGRAEAPAPSLAEDESFRERLLRESRLAASLDHPNVIPIYEARRGRRAAVHRDALRRRDRPQGAAPARGRARARACASRSSRRSPTRSTPHTRRGLVHRDVKPSNVLLDQQGGASTRTSPTSVSRRAPRTASRPTVSLLGTVDYVAPEQIRGDEIDGRADVYALGCLLFETLTGTLSVLRHRRRSPFVYAHLQEGAAVSKRTSSRACRPSSIPSRSGDVEGHGRSSSDLSATLVEEARCGARSRRLPHSRGGSSLRSPLPRRLSLRQRW